MTDAISARPVGFNAGTAARPSTASLATTPAQDPMGQALAAVRNASNPIEAGNALRQLDQLTGTRRASNELAQAGNAEVCTVEVRYNPVNLGPIPTGQNHAFIVTTDNSSVDYFRGGPQANQTGVNSPTSGSGSAANGTNRPAFDPRFGIYGPIITEHGPYREGTVDWTTNPSGSQVVDRIPGNCNRIEGEFRRHMNDIEAARINYMPLNQNSNSTVRETLERAGYPNVSPVVSAPAWNTQLPGPR
jgi:hypothetical protein